MFLGTSESLGAMDTSFGAVSATARLFRKRYFTTGYRPERHEFALPTATAEVRPDRPATEPAPDEWRMFDVLTKSDTPGSWWIAIAGCCSPGAMFAALARSTRRPSQSNLPTF